MSRDLSKILDEICAKYEALVYKSFWTGIMAGAGIGVIGGFIAGALYVTLVKP